MNEVLTFLTQMRSQFIDDLAVLVNLDCGTHNKAGVDTAGQWVAARCHAWDWEVEHFAQSKFGDCWLARLRGSGVGRLMLSGHLDTVYPDGTAMSRPMRFEGTHILGPGTCDMKAGVLAGMYAMRALQVTGMKEVGEVCFFFNSDEEVGSPASRPIYLPIAREMDAALVLEAGRANGDIVSARKGNGLFTIRVRGKAAHAGVEPEKGASAILELAHRIIALHKLNGIAPGVTVNAGLIGGGTRSNVVPDEAWVQLDVRCVDPSGAEKVTAALQEVARQGSIPGTRGELSGGFGSPPMPKTPAIGILAAWAREVGHELGFSVNDTSTGGVSDANMIAGIGVPVLDGLGPVGGLDHGPDEYIDAESIVPRTALVALLIRRTLAERERLSAVGG